jgi:hypothetical protein
MNRGLEEVYRVLGGEAVSGISDKDLRKHLWDNWFDPAPVIQWALGSFLPIRFMFSRLTFDL